MVSEEQIHITSNRLYDALQGLTTLEAIAILEVTKMTLAQTKKAA